VNSEFTAQAGLDGGNITLAAPRLIYLLHSTVTGEADTTGSGFGNGGNLTIDPSFLILNNSGLISKSSFGNGGNITIQSDFFFQSAGVIDASAPFGLPGTVKVSAPPVDLSGVLVTLAGDFLDAGSQLQPDCGVRLSGNISSLIMLGRGGLPIEPGGFVPSSVPTRSDDGK
jgi:large exoprotein involved in heme utilization and adhesion